MYAHKAELQLRRHELRVAEVKAGLRRPLRREDHPFGELCDYWLERRAPLKRSPKDDESIIRRHLRPGLGALRLELVGVDVVDELSLRLRQELAPRTVANILTLLVSMLRLAQDLRWLEHVPRIKKPRVRVLDNDFRYLRNDEEIVAFLEAARSEGEHVFVMYATAVFTGMRAGELAALRWSDLDLVGRKLITVQRSFDGPTKTDEIRHVPVFDALLPTLRDWRLRHGGPLAFRNQAGNMHCPSGRIFKQIFHRVVDAAGFPKIRVRGRDARHIRFHDLRHTFASRWVMRSGDIYKLQMILGHKSIDMTQRYARLAPDAFAGEMGRLGGAELLRPGRRSRNGRRPRSMEATSISTQTAPLTDRLGQPLNSADGQPARPHRRTARC